MSRLSKHAVPLLALLPALVLGLSLAIGPAMAAADDDEDDDDTEESGPPVGQPLGNSGVRLLNGPAVAAKDRFVVVATPALPGGGGFAPIGRRGDLPPATSPVRIQESLPAPATSPSRLQPVATPATVAPATPPPVSDGMPEAVPAAARSTEAPADGDVRSHPADTNVRLVRTENPLMEAAKSRARDSLGQFITTASSPPPGAKGFMLKVALRQNGEVENIWVGGLGAAPGRSGQGDGAPRLSGQLANQPVIVKGLKHGQRVAFTLGDVTDWMYVTGDGRMAGNFTACALAAAESPAALDTMVEKHKLDCAWLKDIQS